MDIQGKKSEDGKEWEQKRTKVTGQDEKKAASGLEEAKMVLEGVTINERYESKGENYHMAMKLKGSEEKESKRMVFTCKVEKEVTKLF